MDDTSIKKNMLRRRTQLGLSQSEMARRLDISLNAYRKLENGDTRIFNIHLGQFANATDTPLSTLVNGFEPVDPSRSGLEDAKARYDRRLAALEEGYVEEIRVLKEEVQRLRDRLKDKEDIIETDKKLIRRYEKELLHRERNSLSEESSGSIEKTQNNL